MAEARTLTLNNTMTLLPCEECGKPAVCLLGFWVIVEGRKDVLALCRAHLQELAEDNQQVLSLVVEELAACLQQKAEESAA